MKGKIAIIGIFVVAIAAILFLTQGSKAPATDPVAGPGPAAASVRISMLYSSEKDDWVKSAAASFQAAHPEIGLDLQSKGSFAGANDILDAKVKPTIFSPADSLAMNLLADDWEAKNHSPLFTAAPVPLVITPLVFVAWEDRAAVLQTAGGGKITWESIHKAVNSNQGWPAIGGKAEWGFVKLGHTNPTQSNSGLQSLFLMSIEHLGRPTLTVADVLDPAYQTWISEVEKGVGKFDNSSGNFMTDMVRFGPSKMDIAVIYENLAISQIGNAQGRWGNLKVYYPSITVWSDHPAAILASASPEEQAAAKLWIDHLLSRPVQESALSYGFRPADTAVPIKTGEANNPFTKYAQYGVMVDIPPVATMPEGAVVRNLMTMWSRVVGVR